MAVKFCVSTHYGIRAQTVTALGVLQRKDVKFGLQIARGRDMASCKNMLISTDSESRHAVPDSEYTHFFFLDQDAIPDASVMEALIDSDKDIAVAAHKGISGEEMACGKWGVRAGEMGETLPLDAVGWHKVDWAMLSCMCVKREVLSTMERPWFHPHCMLRIDSSVTPPREIILEMTPDIGFCWAAQEQGYSIDAYLAPGITMKYMWGEYGLSEIAHKVHLSYISEGPTHLGGESGSNDPR